MRAQRNWSWRVTLGVADLAAARFAISPLFETSQALAVIRGRQPHQGITGWQRWASTNGLEDAIRTPLVDQLAFTDRPTFPEFLTPSPGSLWTTIDDELDTVRRTAADAIAGSIGRVWRDAPLPPAARMLLDEPEQTLARICDELHHAYALLIAPHWPRLHSLLESDVAYKTRRIAQGGYDTILQNLHPTVIWDGATLRVGSPQARLARLSPGGVVFTPSVFSPPIVSVKYTSTSHTAIRYPARGSGDAFVEGSHTTTAGLSRLIGVGRARVLAQLSTPATPTQIAATLNITPSAVNQQLRVLRDAGLVHRDRIGQPVVYSLTTAGSALLHPKRTSHREELRTEPGTRTVSASATAQGHPVAGTRAVR